MTLLAVGTRHAQRVRAAPCSAAGVEEAGSAGMVSAGCWRAMVSGGGQGSLTAAR